MKMQRRFAHLIVEIHSGGLFHEKARIGLFFCFYGKHDHTIQSIRSANKQTCLGHLNEMDLKEFGRKDKVDPMNIRLLPIIMSL